MSLKPDLNLSCFKVEKFSYFKLSRHEVVDDRVDGWVEVAHTVGYNAAIDQEQHGPLVGWTSLLQCVIHNKLKITNYKLG